MPDVSAKADAITPVFLRIAAYLRGLASIESVVRTAWPGVRIEPWQYDIIGHVLKGLTGEFREVAIKGCTGAGKGACVAMAINLWFEASDEAIVVINSQSKDHAVKVMFAEVVKWRRRLSARCPDEILDTMVKVHKQKHIGITNPDKGEGFTGHHGGAVLFVFDECTQTPEEYYELAKTQAHMIIALGNPRTRGGWFKSAFPAHNPDENQTTRTAGGGLRRLITIGGQDCLNVRTGKQIIEGQITRAIYSEIMAHPDANHRRVYGEGKFPIEDSELQLILPSWLGFHLAAVVSGMPEAFGLDVADSDDGDRTFLAAGNRTGLLQLIRRRKANTMQTVGWVLAVVRDRFKIDLTHGQHPICVDADGLGKGAADRLEELGCWVIKHRGSQTADDPRAFYNYRTETYALLSNRLNPAERWAGAAWGLPKSDGKLLEELCAIDKIYESDGMRFRISPKQRPSGAKPLKDHRGQPVQTLKQKLGRSPDRGDATAMLWRAIYTMHYADDENQNMVVRDNEIVIPTVADYEELKQRETDDFDEFFREIIGEGGLDEDVPPADPRDADAMLRRFGKLQRGSHD